MSFPGAIPDLNGKGGVSYFAVTSGGYYWRESSLTPVEESSIEVSFETSFCNGLSQTQVKI